MRTDVLLSLIPQPERSTWPGFTISTNSPWPGPGIARNSLIKTDPNGYETRIVSYPILSRGYSSPRTKKNPTISWVPDGTGPIMADTRTVSFHSVSKMDFSPISSSSSSKVIVPETGCRPLLVTRSEISIESVAVG